MDAFKLPTGKEIYDNETPVQCNPNLYDLDYQQDSPDQSELPDRLPDSSDKAPDKVICTFKGAREVKKDSSLLNKPRTTRSGGAGTTATALTAMNANVTKQQRKNEINQRRSDHLCGICIKEGHFENECKGNAKVISASAITVKKESDNRQFDKGRTWTTLFSM